jgi:hypothetical protein
MKEVIDKLKEINKNIFRRELERNSFLNVDDELFEKAYALYIKEKEKENE